MEVERWEGTIAKGMVNQRVSRSFIQVGETTYLSLFVNLHW